MKLRYIVFLLFVPTIINSNEKNRLESLSKSIQNGDLKTFHEKLSHLGKLNSSELKEMKEQVKAKKYKLITDQEDWLVNSGTKLLSGIRYLGAAFGLWTIGYLCYKGSIEEVDFASTELFVYNCLGIHPIIVPLHSNPQTAYTLLGLCGASALYGSKEVYTGITFKMHSNKKLENAKKMERLVKERQKQ